MSTRIDKLLSDIREVVGDTWSEFCSQFDIDDEGMDTIAAGTHYGTSSQLSLVTPLQAYQVDPVAFVAALRRANPKLMEMPDDEMVSIITGQETKTFNPEN